MKEGVENVRQNETKGKDKEREKKMEREECSSPLFLDHHYHMGER